ncbi:uncharacterized protein ACA1_293940 [Acanthamoeba castellanii str. Neff]|uniref:Uncharacterized protein n=1 Tax=Acanthamoeba castellanii (strain ATCC 30010 / Neff) TaxID=1257118 RepID=L8HL70_ACACF|nr:uncharacterized protein ACA1_293940 [Acanthamoeba castellanii str. Neff]ELR25423.1 hypothetical protein ACA1_293940 [Acanthamoeba castellanii str. Neff]
MTPSVLRPASASLRHSQSRRPVTPVIRIPSLMSTMPGSPGPSTVSALDAKTTSLRIGVPRVELVLYPMGGGLLVFHIDWMPNARNKKLSVM